MEFGIILIGKVVNAAAVEFMSTKHPDRLVLFGLKTQRGSEFFYKYLRITAHLRTALFTGIQWPPQKLFN